MPNYKCWNAPAPTTAVMAKATGVGTVIRTLLQVAPPSTRMLQLVSWGYTLDALPGGPSTIELIQTDVAATVTAHVAAGVQPLDPNGTPSLVTLGTSATGYFASAEGATTASRVFDHNEVPSTAGVTDLSYSYQWMPDERPWVKAATFLRVRAIFATTAPGVACWVAWNE